MESLFAAKIIFLASACVLVVSACLLPDVSQKQLEVCGSGLFFFSVCCICINSMQKGLIINNVPKLRTKEIL